jgi:hypothetical protein
MGNGDTIRSLSRICRTNKLGQIDTYFRFSNLMVYNKYNAINALIFNPLKTKLV